VNLAAAIVRCASSEPLAGLPRLDAHLTNEQALGLAVWLRGQSSISSWRLIRLMEISDCLPVHEESE
jgi:hypothetical protein